MDQATSRLDEGMDPLIPATASTSQVRATLVSRWNGFVMADIVSHGLQLRKGTGIRGTGSVSLGCDLRCRVALS